MKHFIPVIFLLLAACKDDLPPVPKDMIPMEKMVLMLADMHVADAVAETKAQAGADERTLSISYSEQLYKNYGVTRGEFVRSFNFYQGSPKLLNHIYDKVLVELSKREAANSKH